jgi:Asp-tRNA(Asn)/Glu-tRNA(Gln) amidotransferase A subunit family amidase
MGRTVADVARLLDVLAAYDPEDPLTAAAVGYTPETYTAFLDENGLEGARLGVLRESMGIASEPDSEDFAKVARVFENALGELADAGAALVDPVIIPRLNELLATWTGSPANTREAFQRYLGRSSNPPYDSLEDMMRSPAFATVFRAARLRLQDAVEDESRFEAYLAARDELMIHVLKVMADHQLDAIVYNANEHQPTRIEDGTGPPWVNTKGATYLNTFLNFVPAIVVPAGFTADNLPTGITFMARPYRDGTVIRLAYAFEQATHHRKPPESTPPLPQR